MSGWRRANADGSHALGLNPDLQQQEFAVGYNTGAPATISGTEAAPTTLITLPQITFDGATEVIAEFSFETWIMASGALTSQGVNLWDSINGAAAVDSGRWLYANLSTNQFQQGGSYRIRYTPVAGTHVFSARGWTAGSSVGIYGGSGGPGSGNTPMQLSVRRATPKIAVPQARDVYMRLVRTANSANLTTNAWNAVAWQVAQADTDGMWAAGTPDRMTVKTAGKYVLTCGVAITPGDQVNNRHLAFRKNGATFLRRVRYEMPSLTNTPEMDIAQTLDLAVNDYVQAMVWPGNATTAQIYFEADWAPSFEAVRVGPVLA